MSWVDHPQPDEAANRKTGRRILSSSLTRSRGQLGMYAAPTGSP